MSVFQEISDYIDTISVIDTHCHKLPRQVGFPAGIQDLVEHSYLGWCHRDWDGTKEAAAEFVRGLKHNSYFFWIEKSLQKLLGKINFVLQVNPEDKYFKTARESLKNLVT